MRIPFGDLIFQVDVDKARTIATRVYSMFQKREGFYSKVTMPEWILPPGIIEGSKEHALYLTYVISVDYMVNAEKLWQNAREKYSFNPDFFNPNFLLKAEKPLLRAILKDLGVRFINNGVKTWKEISKILVEEFNGDPRNLTPIEMTVGEVKKLLEKFPSLRGYKLSNFYIRAMTEKGLIKVRDPENLEIPVDLQVARFTIYSGVLELESGSFDGCIYELRRVIEITWRKACENTNIKPYELDEPIWQIGSKLCSKKKCNLCPINDKCSHNFKPKMKRARITWEA